MEELLKYAIPIIVVLLWALNHLMGNQGRQPQRRPQGQGRGQGRAPAPPPQRRMAAEGGRRERPQPADRPAHMAAGGRRGGPDEIDRFLQEVAARRRAAHGPQGPEVEVVRPAPAPQPRRPAPPRRPTPRPPARRPPPIDEVEVAAEPRTPAQREAIGRPLRSDLGGHIERYMAPNMEDQVHAHLDHTLGTLESAEKTATPSAPTPAAASVVEMLRTPDNLRNAILLSEILGRPRALR